MKYGKGKDESVVSIISRPIPSPQNEWYKKDTGVDDARGVRIHEGDILKDHSKCFIKCYGDMTEIISVAFRYGQFGVLRYRWLEGGHVKKEENGRFCKDLHGWIESSIRHANGGGHGFIIIGNIHDNPEMINFSNDEEKSVGKPSPVGIALEQYVIDAPAQFEVMQLMNEGGAKEAQWLLEKGSPEKLKKGSPTIKSDFLDIPTWSDK
uniref:Putative YopX protein n=1 Tax=viral metagenome TaxID=1070528 RepID=A0A6M3JMJ0_9ZZZZ